MVLTMAFGMPVFAEPPPPATSRCFSPIMREQYNGKSDLARGVVLFRPMFTVTQNKVPTEKNINKSRLLGSDVERF